MSEEPETLRIMTVVPRCRFRISNETSIVIRAPRAEPLERGFERVARQRVGVLPLGQAIAELHRGAPCTDGQQNAENRVRLGRRLGKRAGVDGLLDARRHLVLHLADEAEALPVAC